MKKIKIVLFTLLLSIIGIIGNINAVSVNISNKSIFSAVNQPVQDSSLSENNIESSKSEKYILWSPRIQSFKQGDQVAILLPNGKYTGSTHSIKIVDHGIEIATLTLENGCDYGIIKFITNANSGEITLLIASLGSANFGTIEAGGVIDIGNGFIDSASSTTSKASVTSINGYSKLSSSQKDDKIEDSVNCNSKITAHSSTIKASSSSLNSTSGEFSRSLSSSEEDGKIVIIKSGSVSKLISSSEKPTSSYISGSKLNEDESIDSHLNQSSSTLSSQIKPPLEIKSSSSTLNASTKISHFSKAIKDSKMKSKKGLAKNMTTSQKQKSTKSKIGLRQIRVPEKKRRASSAKQSLQPKVGQNNSLYLNSQQIQALRHKLHFLDSKSLKIAGVSKKARTQILRYLPQTIVKQKESAKHQNNKYSASSVHRVKLPIQGILPATRMDPYTWGYSLVGLVIMIISGKAFFSKKRK